MEALPSVLRLKASPVEHAPWGYPRVARYCNSDECFAIYRRFGEVFARLLLNKQSEMTNLEDKLRTMDELDSEDAPDGQSRRLMSWKHDRSKSNAQDQTQTRQQLLAEAETKALEYSLSTIGNL